MVPSGSRLKLATRARFEPQEGLTLGQLADYIQIASHELKKRVFLQPAKYCVVLQCNFVTQMQTLPVRVVINI